MEKKRLKVAEDRAMAAEKLSVEAMKDKELAEERVNELLRRLEIKIDTEYERIDAPRTRSIMSRPLLFTIICIILLVTTIIVLTIELNGSLL